MPTGRQRFLQQLVEKYQGYAFTLAFRLLWDEEDARDTVQDSFLSVLETPGENRRSLQIPRRGFTASSQTGQRID